MRKFKAGIRAHKRINLLNDDTSSEDDDQNSLSYMKIKSIPSYEFRTIAGKFNSKNRRKPSRGDQRKFVTLTKIDLSDTKKFQR